MKTHIRINGIAPAWPALLGSSHPMYPSDDFYSMSSASYSVCGTYSGNRDKAKSGREVLIDAGHHTVPYLLKHGNRIPDAILLTHGHPDHILGVDWIVQSHRFSADRNTKLPIYCTDGAWQSLMLSYAYIEPYVHHKLLLPGVKMKLEEAEDISVTSFPVYHGDGALGASMLFIEPDNSNTAPVVITGDMLCPLLRKKDYQLIKRAGTLIVDTNNRFPDPHSNHISFTQLSPLTKKMSEKLFQWFQYKKIADLIKPHKTAETRADSFFEEFLSDWKHTGEIPHTIVDFLKLTGIPQVYLVHYWGIYDEKHYGEPLLDAPRLEEWANGRADGEGIRNTRFIVPKVGDIVYF